MILLKSVSKNANKKCCINILKTSYESYIRKQTEDVTKDESL